MHDMNLIVPKARLITNERTGEVLKDVNGKDLPKLDMYGFMLDIPLASAKVGGGSPGLRLRERMKDLFRTAPEGSTVKVAAGDYEKIMEILRDHPWGYMTIASHYLDFIEAWEKAVQYKEPEAAPALASTP